MLRLFAHSAASLSDLLARRQVSSVELVQAHLARIDRHDRKLLAFTTVFHEMALAEARKADDERAKGLSRGPLHGLPVTVKESLDIERLPSTLGVVARTSHRAPRDAAIVAALREAGAILLGRTNVSQLLLFHESSNPLFGRAANPFSLAHTPGGSSGGEAAAIAAGLSPLGIGTDIGGSIRVPAHFCGIAGFKPTLDRWPCAGASTALAGQEAIRGQVGPMARSAADLAFAMRALPAASLNRLDGRVPPLPFADPASIDLRRIRVGFYTDAAFVSPSRAVARAVDEAARALAAQGCSVEPFTPPGLEGAILLYFQAMTADGGKSVDRALAGGEIEPVLAGMRRVTRLPPLARAAAAQGLRLAGEHGAATLVESMGERDVAALWQLTASLRGYRATVLDALDRAGIDVLLCPAHATPALPHGRSRDFVAAGSHSMLFNVLQLPAGVVPVTRVRPDEVRRGGGDRFGKIAAEVDAQSAGLPVGVQVAGRPFADETVLAVMMAIERGLATSGELPPTPVEL